MKFLSHSNGLHKVKMRKEWSLKDILKIVFISIAVLLLCGFLYQKVSNFIDGERLKPRVDYTRVNNMRLDYVAEGQGNYTVIFDGNIGANLSQWNGITDKLNSQQNDIKTFVYNRRGYGYSDGGPLMTPEEQAEDLKILLRKAAASPPYILVGEEYGSLVMTNFAKLYPDTVKGVVLVNPILEKNIGTKEFSKENRLIRVRRGIERFGAKIGLTSLLDKCNLDIKMHGFEDKLKGSDLEEFKVMRTKSSYADAAYDELTNLLDGTSESQTEGLLSKIPYYLIAKDGQESLKKLGDESITNVTMVKDESNFISMDNEDKVIEAIKTVVKEAKKLEKTNHKQ